jgi:hypothetical protein
MGRFLTLDSAFGFSNCVADISAGISKGYPEIPQ